MNPTTVITASGEVQTNEQGTVHVHDLGLFVTVQTLKDTPAVLSLDELCDDHGYSFDGTSGQNHTSWQTAENTTQHEKLCTDDFPRIINQFFQFDCKYVSNIVAENLDRRLCIKSSDHAKSKCTQSSTGTTCAVPNNQRMKTRTSIQKRETCCEICQDVWRISQQI